MTNYVVTGRLARATGEAVGGYAFDAGGLAVAGEEDNYAVVLAAEAEEFAITNRPLTAEMITIAPGQDTYSGEAKSPPTTVAWTGETGALDESHDIATTAWVPAGDKVEAGTYWYVVTAKEGGNFAGVASNKYVITAREIVIQVPTTNTCYGAGSDDITVAYAVTNGALQAGDAFDGAIRRADLANTHVGAYDFDVSDIRIKHGGTDVTASYSIVWDLGQYVITNKLLTAEMFTLNETSHVYDTLQHGPDGVTASDPEGPIVATPGTDYRWTPMAKETQVGVYTQRIEAVEGGNYAGFVELEYAITPIPLEGDGLKTFDVIPTNFTYNAAEQTPALNLVYRFNNGGQTGMDTNLVLGVDYTVTYPDGADLTNVGVKTGTVTFTSILSGTTNFTWTISPATLTIVASNQVVNYGAAWPTDDPEKGADYGIDGIQGADDLDAILNFESAKFATDRTQFSPVGNGYWVEVTNVAFSSQAITNYVLAAERGVLTVVPALPEDIEVVSWASVTNTYNATARQVTEKPVVRSGETVINPTNIVLRIEPATGFGDDFAKTAGVYRVVAWGTGDLPAVPFATNETGFVILPYGAEIGWDKRVFDYNGLAQKPTGTVTNLFAGDTCDVIVTVLPAAIEPGDYTGAVTLANANYALKDGDDEVEFKIVKSWIQDVLEEKFGVPPGTVEPQADDAGNVTNWVVTLGDDLTGVIEIPDNLGSFTLDLNGHVIAGTNGVDGADKRVDPATDGGSAILIVPGDYEKGTDPTRLFVTETNGTAGAIIGGDGGDGHPAGKGAPAIGKAEGILEGVGFAADPEELLVDGDDGIDWAPETLALVELRNRYPWQDAVDATYEIPLLNTSDLEYMLVVTVTNAANDQVKVFTNETVALGANRVVCDGLNDVLDNQTGTVEVAAALYAALTNTTDWAVVAAAAAAAAEIDGRDVKPIKVGETAMFNISSNVWDAEAGGAAHVGYTRDGLAYGTLDPVQDRVTKAWMPVEDGLYEFTLTPGGDIAKFQAVFPANVTNSFPKESFDIVWDPKAGTNGAWRVTLREDLTGPLMVADDIGNVILDMDGHVIAGTNAVNETGGDGGHAIVFTAMDPDGGIDEDTHLRIIDTDPRGDGSPCVLGGNGASGLNPGDGGIAVTTNGNVRTVSVTVGQNAIVKGGNGGDGGDGDSSVRGQGAEACDPAASEVDGGKAVRGDDGLPGGIWAWCRIATPLAEVPEGVTQVGDALLFWRRDPKDKGAVFDFSEVTGHGIVDDTIYFVDGTIKVHGLTVPADADSTLVFTCTNSATTLQPVEHAGSVVKFASVFTVTADAGQVRRFEDLKFASPYDVKPTYVLPYDGCAINMEGGTLEVANCEFDGCAASELGGAIAAFALDADSMVTGSVFTACSIRDEVNNGYGGAIHASAATDGVKLTIVGSAFSGNTASAGGAISTMCVSERDVANIALVLKGVRFENNASFWEGGAIDAGGDLVVEGASVGGATVFQGNRGGYFGGAIYIGDSVDGEGVTTVSIGSNTLFIANSVSNDVYYTEAGGGAIMVQSDKSVEFSTYRAIFDSNVAQMPLDGDWPTYADGGAVCFAFSTNTVAAFTKTAFVRNAAIAPDEVTGGAISTRGTPVAVDNCVFDANTVGNYGADFCTLYDGGAIYACDTAVDPLNSTFRGSNVEAVMADRSSLDIVNCVLVGNDLECPGENFDLWIFDTAASMAYSAYGGLNIAGGSTLSEDHNLTNRTSAIYLGDTLELDPAFNGGFNPVAVLGLEQPGVTDFKEVGYGTLPLGSSMGAFECPAMLPVLTVDGDRRYDGTTNGLENTTNEYVWTLTSTNGLPWVWPELGPITNQLVVTNWYFGDKNAGDYCSTNAAPGDIVFGIAANPELPEEEQARINELIGFLRQIATGTIERRPVVFQSESAEKAYDTLPLTRHEASDVSHGTLDEPCGLVPGETVTFDFTGSQTEVGSSSNWFEVVWGTAEASNYDLRPYVYGTLTVTSRSAGDITVLPVPDFVYGGTNITPRVTVVITNAVGEVITNLVEGVDFEVAYEDNLNVFDNPYLVVTPSTNFTGTVTNAFRILPRPVTFVSASAEKEYDGTPLKTNEVTWTRQDEDGPGTGIVATEERYLGFDVTGSQTEVGVSSNWYEVVWNEGIDIRNYVPTYEYGTLTVWQKPFPEFEIVSAEWYHNRGDGLYYPRIVIRFTGGDAARLSGLTLTCEGERYALPESCVAELRTAKLPGQEFVFGVDPDKFPVSYSRTERDGYIIWQSAEEKERAMLFGSYQAVRPLTLELKVDATPAYDDPAAAVRSARAAEPAEVAASAAPRLVQGVAFSRVLTDAPAPKITASGLPRGLKVVATAVREKVGKRTATVGYTCVLSGTPTKAGTYRAKFKQKIGKETVITEETFKVEPLPLWAYGTFTGWSVGDAVDFSDVGVASLKVTSAGKISGKFAVGGTTWSFSAKAYAAAPEDDGGAFIAEVEAKSGKSVRKMRLAVSPDCFRSCSYAGLEGDGVAAGLRRSVWKDKPKAWTIGKAKFTLAPLGLADVSVSVAVSGTVRFSGKLPDGTKVSCSTTAYVAEDGSLCADLIVPAKKDFAGWMTDVLLEEGAR